MNIGIVAALIAAVGYSLRSIGYKKLNNDGFDRYIINFSFRVIYVILSFLIIVFTKQQVFTDWGNLTVIIGMAVCIIPGFIADQFYYKGIEESGVSVASILSRTSPIFSLLISVVVFHEIPGSRSLIGISLIVLISMTFGYLTAKSNLNTSNGKGLANIIIAQFLYVITSFAMAQLYDEMGVFNFMMYFSIISGLIYLFPVIRKKSYKAYKTVDIKKKVSVLGVGLIGFTAFAANTLAMGTVLVPVAFAMTSFSIIVSVVLGYLFLDEKDSLLVKSLTIVGMIVGGYLLIG